MYGSQQIADWFIARSRAELRLDDSAEPITNMKLNKLMYFAQGIYLALYNERLFDDEFYAFEHGPIVGKIHDKYKGKDIPELNDYISDERAVQLANNYDWILSDKKAAEVLDATWQKYGKYTASYLRKLTHDDRGPWAKVYNKDQTWILMDDHDIEKYFEEFVVECQ